MGISSVPSLNDIPRNAIIDNENTNGHNHYLY